MDENLVAVEKTNNTFDFSNINYSYDKIIHISTPVEWNTFIDTLSNYLVLVKFGAKWCTPCQDIHPVFEELAMKKNLICVEIDVDSAEDISNVCEIKQVPTFHFIYNKKLLDELNSANKDNLLNTFNNCLKYIKKE